MTPLYNDNGDQILVPDDAADHLISLGWSMTPPGIERIEDEPTDEEIENG